DRVKKYRNFQLLTDASVVKVIIEGKKVVVATAKNNISSDFLILATGFSIDGSKQPELRAIFNDILLWKDRHHEIPSSFGNYPYLTPHMQFMEKENGKAAFLRDIYCFNYAAVMSHGLTTGDIPNISTGAQRLAKAIVADFFTQESSAYLARLQAFQKPEFLEESYPFISLFK
ncbi:MAG TPA: hypothetical protein VN457_05580, partial [Chlamydiales bacterium]|nr:hypothetical protein [Chlamydiales bacterium]